MASSIASGSPSRTATEVTNRLRVLSRQPERGLGQLRPVDKEPDDRRLRQLAHGCGLGYFEGRHGNDCFSADSQRFTAGGQYPDILAAQHEVGHLAAARITCSKLSSTISMFCR